MIIYMISELMLYLCFSILTGTLIFALIPNHKKPTLVVQKRWLQLAILGIVLFSAMPVVQVVMYFYDGHSLLQIFSNVVNNFEVGRSWSFILLLSIFYYFFISVFPVQHKRIYTIIALAFLFSLILAVGWASHSASLSKWVGFTSHIIHFSAVSVWVGILFVVSWFSKDTKNWVLFLKWYSPTAIGCFTLTLISGLLMMSLVVELTDYANSWLIDYGQALLIKHLFIIPLLIFAFMNGWLIKRLLKNNRHFNPKPWVKGESLLLLFIFSATAFLGQSAPPHDIPSTLQTNGVSNVIQYFYSGDIENISQVQLSLSGLGLIFMLLASVFLVLLIFSFTKKTPAILSFLISFFFVLSVYFSLMTNF